MKASGVMGIAERVKHPFVEWQASTLCGRLQARAQMMGYVIGEVACWMAPGKIDLVAVATRFAIKLRAMPKFPALPAPREVEPKPFPHCYSGTRLASYIHVDADSIQDEDLINRAGAAAIAALVHRAAVNGYVLDEPKVEFRQCPFAPGVGAMMFKARVKAIALPERLPVDPLPIFFETTTERGVS